MLNGAFQRCDASAAIQHRSLTGSVPSLRCIVTLIQPDVCQHTIKEYEDYLFACGQFGAVVLSENGVPGWIFVQNLVCAHGLTALSLQTFKFQPYSLSAGGAGFEFASIQTQNALCCVDAAVICDLHISQ